MDFHLEFNKDSIAKQAVLFFIVYLFQNKI